jgi:hypothetical protein
VSLQQNIEAASTMDAFMRESRDKEAKMKADLEAMASQPPKPRTPYGGGSSSSSGGGFTRGASVAPRATTPLADSPTRTVFRSGDARSQLMGHVTATSAGFGAGSGAGAGGGRPLQSSAPTGAAAGDGAQPLSTRLERGDAWT